MTDGQTSLDDAVRVERVETQCQQAHGLRPARSEQAAQIHEDHDTACSGSEAFALRVLGTSMEPEFNEGEIIIIEPEGQLKDGSFVLAQHEGEWIFRQLCQAHGKPGAGWMLHALNPAFPDLPLSDLSAVRGVIIQKSLPGRRRASKRYI